MSKPAMTHGKPTNQKKEKGKISQNSQVLLVKVLFSPHQLRHQPQFPKKSKDPDVYNVIITHQSVDKLWPCAECLSVGKNLGSCLEEVLSPDMRRCCFSAFPSQFL